MSLFDQLIYQNKCSNATFHLVCLVYAPVCITNQRHKVCWRLCDYVSTGCAGNFEVIGLPPLLRCDNPDIYSNESTSICPPDFAALQIPRTAAPTPPPATPSSVAIIDSIRRPGENH